MSATDISESYKELHLALGGFDEMVGLEEV
jgi:hypothetical protein